MHWIAATLASLLVSAALILQAHDAREAPADLSLRPSLIWFLMRRWRWLLGTALTIASALLQVYALSRLSVAVVQSISAAGVLVLPLHSALVLHQRLRGAELAAIAGVVAGVTAASLTVPDQASALPFDSWPVFVAAAAICVAALLAARRLRSATAMSVVAAIGFGAAALLQKVLAVSPDHGAMFALAIALFVFCGAIGFLGEMSALQISEPVRVAPVILALSTALPVLSAPFVLGERWPRPPLTLAALFVTLGCATYIARLAHRRGVTSPSLATATPPTP